tara:strand:- start:21 stop:1145 length:1125 start_codon:yes stop_codon:yes gene_type:complete
MKLSKNKKKVGILLTNNLRGGIARLSAMMANDIGNKHTDVVIFIPILPYFTYYFKVFKRPIFWLLKIAPTYLKNWIFDNKFVYQEILNKKKISKKIIKTKFFVKRISKKNLDSLDCIIFNGIGDVYEYQFTNIKKKIYLVNQLEEVISGHKKLFQKIRRNFNGKIITHCNFMKKKLSSHVNKIKIIPNPISQKIWKCRNSKKVFKKRNDLLVYWRNDNFLKETISILDEFIKLKPDIKITIFARQLYDNKKLKNLCKKYKIKLVFPMNEKSISNLYLGHEFLLYPNTYEDFGMPPVESLACGCIPIQRSNVGAADMYSIDNYNSIHIDDNHKKLAKRVKKLFDDKKKLLKLRKNTIKNLDLFSPKNYGKKILNS